MKIVLDANIIIGALLGSRSKIIIVTSQNHEFYVPEIITKEIRKYKAQICNKVGYSEEEFEIYLNSILEFVNEIKVEEYKSFMEMAQRSIEKRDVKDSDYIACALLVSADFIWTEDKDFSSQNIAKIKSTEELIEDNK